MKFGLTFANSGPLAHPDVAVEFVRAAEEAGFESLWAVEHVVVPAGYESVYPYSSSGRMPGGDEAAIPDPLVWLAYVARATKNITLATGMIILPQRNPLVLAKETASLDVLSGGRFVLGVGVGWLREEFAALGVPFEQRGARADDYIRALRTLWTEEEAAYEGRFVSFEPVRMYPKPVRPGGIPIHIGGHTRSAARRAGRLGDGFFPARVKPDDLAELLEILRAAATETGRDPAAIEITTGVSRNPETVRRLVDLGVDRLVVAPPATDLEGLRRALGEFSEHIIEQTP